MRLGRRRGELWFDDDKRRAIFEGNAPDLFPGIRGRTEGRGTHRSREYTVALTVLEVGIRAVEITFKARNPPKPVIRVDGPEDSPHRYADGSLCVWDWRDPESSRWVVDDGLVHLLRLVQGHLFREDWYREWGEWPGPESPHTIAKTDDVEPTGAVT